ncbi:MAG: hypothetical protein IKF99_09215, partial [Oscillospiraceae bacterium]|nr:hypothetical protein [Oscillospiraceae bacterium]
MADVFRDSRGAVSENVPGAHFPRDRARPQAGESLLLRHVRIAILTKWQSYFLPNSALNAFNYGCSWYF